MSQYYIASGRLQVVVTAKTRRGAALWAVHRSLAQVLPLAAGVARPADEPDRELAPLGETVTASERGFDGADAARFDTFELVTEWNQLLLALERMESLSGQRAA